MKEKLENILNSVKKYGKKAIVTMAISSILAGPAYSNKVSIYLSSVQGNTNNSTFTIGHHTDASSAAGWGDILFYFLSGPYNESLDIYENFSPSYDFMQDAREDGNMDTITAEIEGRGRDYKFPIESEISVGIIDFNGENNMTNKKIIGKLYEIIDGNDVLVRTYDCWNMHESGQKAYLTVKDGSSHRWETSFHNTNIADFDNDGDVDFKDYTILSAKWRNPVGNYLADISGPAGTSDGVVDKFDLKTFVANWLD